jgi:hypothetical protein
MTIIGPNGKPLVSSSTPLTTSQLVAKIESPDLPKAAEEKRLHGLRETHKLVYPPLLPLQGVNAAANKHNPIVDNGRVYLPIDLEDGNGDNKQSVVGLKVFSKPTAGQRDSWWGALQTIIGIGKPNSSEGDNFVEMTATKPLGDKAEVVTQKTRPSFVIQPGSELKFEISIPNEDILVERKGSYTHGLERYTGTKQIGLLVELDGGLPTLETETGQKTTDGKKKHEQLIYSFNEESPEPGKATVVITGRQVTNRQQQQVKLGEALDAKVTNEPIIFTVPQDENAKLVAQYENTSKGTLRVRVVELLTNLEQESIVQSSFPGARGYGMGGFEGGGGLKTMGGFAPGGFDFGPKSKPEKTQINGVVVLKELGRIDVALLGPTSKQKMTANQQDESSLTDVRNG